MYVVVEVFFAIGSLGSYFRSLLAADAVTPDGHFQLSVSALAVFWRGVGRAGGWPEG